MSCGRNHRRLKLSSTFNSRLHNHHESSITNTQSTGKIHQLSRSRKINHSENLSKQISRENPIDFDQFRVLRFLF
jgi:hypothetical protein